MKLTSILVLVLTVLSFVSCSKEQVGDPYILFEVYGKVVDSEGNPIEGIVVSSGLVDEQKTNMNGNFSFFGRSHVTTNVSLTFEDKDGDKNGGEFVKMSQRVTLIEKTPGTSGNFKGTYYAGNVVVVMLGKTNVLPGGSEDSEDPEGPDGGFIPL